MTRLVSLSLLLALAGQSDPPPTFKAGVDLVSVSVVVNRHDGRPVTGLSRKDFELFDGGFARAITDFRAEATPVSVAVLLDTSGSMQLSGKWNSARDVVTQMSAELARGRDHIALFAFDADLHVVQPFTTSPSEVVSALDKVRPWGSTALFDAVAKTGKQLDAEGGMRRAIVLITDGFDNRSRLDATDVSAAASALDMPVYTFVVSSALDQAQREIAMTGPGAAAALPARGTIADLSRWTGGALFVSGSPLDTASAVKQLVSELRHQYVMTFESGTPSGWHALLVRVHDGNNFVVRTRSGYMAGPRS